MLNLSKEQLLSLVLLNGRELPITEELTESQVLVWVAWRLPPGLRKLVSMSSSSSEMISQGEDALYSTMRAT